MKKLVSVTEVEGEGLESLLGENVLLLCTNYFYTGKLIGVNTNDVLLENPSIVYETGEWAKKGYGNAEKLPMPLYVRIAAIESYGLSK